MKGVDFRQLVAVEAALKKVKGMQKVVQRSYHDGPATLECRFREDARTLAIHIGQFQSPKLKIVSVERNRIEISHQQLVTGYSMFSMTTGSTGSASSKPKTRE